MNRVTGAEFLIASTKPPNDLDNGIRQWRSEYIAGLVHWRQPVGSGAK